MKVENITLSGVIEGANVKLTYSRENEKPIRQITVQADKRDSEGEQYNVYIDYQLANRSVIINAYNCDLENVPVALIDGILKEMRAVNSNNQ